MNNAATVQMMPFLKMYPGDLDLNNEDLKSVERR